MTCSSDLSLSSIESPLPYPASSSSRPASIAPAHTRVKAAAAAAAANDDDDDDDVGGGGGGGGDDERCCDSSTM